MHIHMHSQSHTHTHFFPEWIPDQHQRKKYPSLFCPHSDKSIRSTRGESPGRAGMGQMNPSLYLRGKPLWSRVIANLVFSPAWQLLASPPLWEGCNLAQRPPTLFSPPRQSEGSPLAKLWPLQAQAEGLGLQNHFKDQALLLCQVLPAKTGPWSYSWYSALAHLFNYSYRLLRPWDSPGKNTGVGCHFLLQGIFLTQGSNPGLLHCRQML